MVTIFRTRGSLGSNFNYPSSNATSLRVIAAIVRRVEFPQYASSYTPPVGKIAPEFDPQVLGSEIGFILAVVNTVLTRVTPSELHTMQEIDAGYMLLNHLRPLLTRMPAAVSAIVVAALQDGLSAWLKPSTSSNFAQDAYNEKVSRITQCSLYTSLKLS